MAETKLRKIDWAEADELTTHVAAQLSYPENLPDCIVGLARGGLIPAVCLHDGKVSSDKELLEAQLINLDKYNNIAIVDDICDSGKTMHALDIRLNARGHSNIKWCTLLHKTSALFQPKIIGEVINEIDESDWIVFPWED